MPDARTTETAPRPAYPEIADKRKDIIYQILWPQKGALGHVDKLNMTFHHTGTCKAITRHELGHSRWSPIKVPDLGIDPRIIQSVEDARVNLALEKCGVPSRGFDKVCVEHYYRIIDESLRKSDYVLFCCAAISAIGTELEDIFRKYISVNSVATKLALKFQKLAKERLKPTREVAPFSEAIRLAKEISGYFKEKTETPTPAPAPTTNSPVSGTKLPRSLGNTTTPAGIIERSRPFDPIPDQRESELRVTINARVEKPLMEKFLMPSLSQVEMKRHLKEELVRSEKLLVTNEQKSRPRTKGREEHIVWGDVIFEDSIPLTERISKTIRAVKRNVPSEEGIMVRYIHRILSDFRIFSKAKKINRGSVLLDQSGSMGLPTKAYIEIVKAMPLGVVATYSGDGENGRLRIVAKEGSMASRGFMHRFGGGNTIDLPALEWLAEQEEPRLWFSDGLATSLNECHNPMVIAQCKNFAEAHNIFRTDVLEVALKYISKTASTSLIHRKLTF